MEHTSHLQRWEVASESNALPCQGSYFRLRSLFCDLLTGFLLYFEEKKGKRPRLKIAVRHSATSQPVLQENFPGNVKLKLQPQKHQLRNGTSSDYLGEKNSVLGDNSPCLSIAHLFSCGEDDHLRKEKKQGRKAGAVPKAGGEKAGSGLEKQARSLPVCQAWGLVLQTKPKQMQPRATGGKQH